MVRTGLKGIVEKYRLEVRLTPQQNVYLVGIREQDRATIAALLREHGIAEPEALPPVLRQAISCPAPPTCGQAITESERIMPEVVAEIQDELNAVGLTEDVVHPAHKCVSQRLLTPVQRCNRYCWRKRRHVQLVSRGQ